jgi:signal transduction histidine kinase
VEYLTALGVKSSLVVPILHQQQLWGLLVSHHAEAKAFSEEVLGIVQMIADQVSIAIAQSMLLSQAREQARREAIINQISTLLHAPLNIQEMLQIVLEQVVKAVQGSGGRLYLPANELSSVTHLYTYGFQPVFAGLTADLLEGTEFWQQLLGSPETRSLSSTETSEISTPPALELSTLLGDDLPAVMGEVQQAGAAMRVVTDLYQEPILSSLWPAFTETEIRGLLIMPLRYGQEFLGSLTLFRNEIETETLWAGRWDSDHRQERPRGSFAAWRELKSGQAQPWSSDEIGLIQALGAHLSMAVMQNRLYQCEREQRLLVEMRNQELNSARAVAEEASRLKSDFLSSTSHELRTPLASTLNYLKLLKEGFYDNEEELKEYVQVAYQAAENLVAIINDVLDIAKIEAGRMSVNLEFVNLPDLLQEERNLFNLESHRKGIDLIIDCDVEQVYADKVKLRQVLTNLLSNALKFTSQGSVHLQARWCPQTAAQASCIEISVADTGIGIDLNKRDLLFEPFVQADGSIKRRYGGTGLGLTICKRLVELMGGQIWLESPGLGEGTTVTFTLPSIST